MIFVAPAAFSQNGTSTPIPSVGVTIAAKPKPVSVLLVKPPVVSGTALPFLSPNYYAAHLGFFCRKEIKIEKAAKIPLKFRLGSVADCDRLEGKTYRP